MLATISLVNVCDFTQLQFISFDENSSPDTITALLTGCTPIQNVFGVKKNSHDTTLKSNILSTFSFYFELG